jgi:hypothetical protein
MNERIKELAEQCWDRRLDGVHFDIEKFAELVIGHCCPKRSWVGLTDEELIELSESGLYLLELWRALEARLKEKNGG